MSNSKRTSISYSIEQWVKLLDFIPELRFTHIEYFKSDSRLRHVRSIKGIMCVAEEMVIGGTTLTLNFYKAYRWTANGHCYQGKNRFPQFDFDVPNSTFANNLPSQTTVGFRIV